MDNSKTGFSGFNECKINPKKCNNVDILIYVMPLCPTLSAGIEIKRKLQCIKDSMYQTCFPYCVGLHQKGGGTTPITLYNRKTLSDGVYIANSDCLSSTTSIDNRSVSMTTTVVSKDYNTFKSYGLTSSEGRTSDLNYVCTFSKLRSSIVFSNADSKICTEGGQKKSRNIRCDKRD